MAISVIVGLVVYVYYLRNDLARFHRLEPRAVGMLAVIAFLSIFIQGVILRSSLKPFEISIGLAESFGIMILTLCANYVLPFSGIGFRMEYLRRTHGLSYAHFFSSAVAICVTEVFVFSVLGLIGMMNVIDHYGVSEQFIVAFLVGTSIGMLYLIVASPTIPTFDIPFSAKIRKLIDGWTEVRKSPWVVSELLMLTLGEFLTCSLLYYFGFRAISIYIGPSLCSIIASLSDFSFFFRIAPASLGTYEASIVYASSLAGISGAQALLVAFLVRVVSIIWFLALGTLAFFLLVKPKNGVPDMKNDSLE